MLTIGSLFSGIGGLELGLEWAGLGPVLWQVEKDEYCRKVLAKHWPNVKRYENVRTVGSGNLERVDLICGGFPCQDLSYAGRGAGIKDGTRSGLWFEFARIIGEIRPRFVVVENVPALLTRGLDVVLGQLAALGFDAWWDCIPAQAVGAPHRRDRVFIVGYTNSHSKSAMPVNDEAPGMQGNVANPNNPRLEGRDREELPECSCKRIVGEGGALANANSEQARRAAIPRRECGGGGIKSGIRRVSYELSEGLDRLDIVNESHYTMGITQGKNKNAHATKKRPPEKVRLLRETAGSKTNKWTLRRSRRFSKKKVLRQGVHVNGVYHGRCQTVGTKETSRKTPRGCVRNVCNQASCVNSPQGQKPSEQRSNEPDDIMRFMSHQMALETWQKTMEDANCLQGLWRACKEIGYVPKALSEIQEIWRSMSYEEKKWACLRISTGSPWCSEWPGVTRTATGVKNRPDRLRALGNAVVPQVAYVIGMIVKELALESAPPS